MSLHQQSIQTHNRCELIEVTEQVQDLVTRANMNSGFVIVYCPHTTAAMTINENADPDVVHDLLLWYNRTVPHEQPGFRHGEGNSDSHIKATLVGPSVTLLVEGGDVVLGRWQGVFFCEFDGPRTRTVQMHVVGS